MKGKKRGHDERSKPIHANSKSAKRRARKMAEEDDEEKRLTSLLFGGGSGTFPQSAHYEEEFQSDRESAEPSGSFGFEIDRTGVEGAGQIDDNDDKMFVETERITHPETVESAEDEADKPAWVDEDDEEVQVNLFQTNRLRKLRKTRDESAASALDGRGFTERLRERYKATMQKTARTDWANVDEDDDNVEEDGETMDDEIDDGPLLRVSSRRLPPNLLSVVRCPDANQSDPNSSVVQSVHFHPGSDADRPLMLTAGMDKTLRFFQVGEEESVKVHGIHCKSLDIF